MTTGGFSQQGLERVSRVLSGHVEEGHVPGLVSLIARRGDVQVNALGIKTAAGREPIEPDSIFRIASMTKPIVAAAALLLVEECTLRLDEPVTDWLPELADRKVLRRMDGPIDDTVPALRAITLRDLLTFRMGFGMPMGRPGRYPVLQAMGELGIVGMWAPDPATPVGPDEWLRRFATLPLLHQPGERWMYNTAYYVLGVLLARASGRPLEDFLRERIFQPLGMKDTGFSVPAASLARFTDCIEFNAKAGAEESYDDRDASAWSKPPAFPDAAAGLVSTARDYLAFAQLLLGNGLVPGGKGERLLSRASIEAMTTDQLTPEQKAVSGYLPGQFNHRGFGFGVSMVTHRDSGSATPGAYGWDGGLGSSWRNDPREDLVGVLLTARIFDSPVLPRVCQDFWTATYAALDD